MSTPSDITRFLAPTPHPCEPAMERDGSTRPSLLGQVMRWPTPLATDGSHGGPNQRDSKGGLKLPSAVFRCPTPSANDWKCSSKAGQRRGQLTAPAMGVIPPGGKLNPTWVEWLMGFPPGWTDLGDSETPSSPRSPSSSGGD